MQSSFKLSKMQCMQRNVYLNMMCFDDLQTWKHKIWEVIITSERSQVEDSQTAPSHHTDTSTHTTYMQLTHLELSTCMGGSVCSLTLSLNLSSLVITCVSHISAGRWDQLRIEDHWCRLAQLVCSPPSRSSTKENNYFPPVLQQWTSSFCVCVPWPFPTVCLTSDLNHYAAL